MKRKGLVTIIRRSCLTGNAVWVYRGPSEHAASMAYRRACKKEIERVRNWPQIVKKRAEQVSRILNEALADIPLNVSLTPRQKESVRQLKAIQNHVPECHREFYDHIMEEARRKNEASNRWADYRTKNFGLKKQ